MSGEIIVVGLGKSNLGVVQYLLKKGINPLVVDTRDNPPLKAELPLGVELRTGSLDSFQELFVNAKTLITGPGTAIATPAINEAIKKGVEVIGDIELFVRDTKSPIVGITGANGKSTVTTLVYLMAKEAGIKVGIGGNIGIAALSLLDDPCDLYVLELSSFQLETTKSLKAAAATILNVTEDHMDRYEFDIEKYAEAKKIIYKNAQNIVYNREDARTIPEKKDIPSVSFGSDSDDYGLIYEGDKVFLAKQGRKVMDTSDMKIVGQHNHMNALAAMALCDKVGVPEDAQINVLRSFTGLEHRCQLVSEIKGVRYYNDSKATNVGSTLAAVSGLSATVKGDIYLIAGGIGKGQNFAPIGELLKDKIKVMYCFGRDANQLLCLGDNALKAEDLKDALDQAYNTAKAGDVVLLAPACASMDLFKNFEERGRVFVELVQNLRNR